VLKGLSDRAQPFRAVRCRERGGRISISAFLLAALACFPILKAGQYGFHDYGGEYGLTNLVVQNLFQDHAGFLWVVTENGVFRFDGERFRRFGPDEGLPRTAFASIGEAPDGSVLVGSPAGLFRNQGNRFVALKLPGASAVSSVQGVASDGAGHTFIATDKGLAEATLAPGADLRLRLLPVPAGVQDPLFAALFSDRGALWFRCDQALCRLEGDAVSRFGQPEGLPASDWISIARDGQGDLWAASRRELAVLRPGADRFELFTAGLPAASIGYSLAVDRKGRLLIPTTAGLAIQDAGGFRIFGKQAGLNPPVNAVLQDREGSVWLGYAGHGLARWLGYGEWVAFQDASGLTSGFVYEILPLSGSLLWVGTDTGLFRGRKTGDDWKWERIQGLGVVSVHAVRRAPDGKLWLGTEGRGVAQFDPASGRVQWFSDAHGLLADSPETLEIDHTGRVWLGTERGLFVTTAARGRFNRVAEIPAIRVWSVAEAPNGDLWAGTVEGLFHLAGNQWRRLTKADGLVQDSILSTAVSRSGEVWVGYPSTSTITRIQGPAEQPQMSHFGRDQGLTGGMTYALAADAPDRLWAGTDQGAFFWDGKVWTRYAHGDGLVWDHCALHALAMAPDGSFWIGTSAGLSHFSPAGAPPIPAPPDIVFTTLQLGRSEFSPSAPVSVDGRSNTLTVCYSALAFTHPGDILFRYRLAPLSAEWSETTRREIQFPDLPPGAYRVQVAARGASGQWSPQPATFGFEIRPLWWQSWWFRILVIVLPLVLSVWLLLRRERQEAAQIESLEEAVEQRSLELRDQTAELQRRNTVAAEEKARTEAAARARNEFLAGVSNAGRAAVSGLASATGLLLAAPSNPQQQELLSIVKSSSDSLRALLNDLLDFSEMEAGRLEIDCAPFAVAHAVGGACRQFLPETNKKGLSLTWEFAPQMPEFVLGDGDRLRQALLSLVGNAVNSTEDGGVRVEVSWRQLEGDAIELSCAVVATGSIIPAEQREELPGSGPPGDASATPGFGATGLGLAIASRLVGLMGGRIAVENGPGASTVFRFTILVRRATAAGASPEPPGGSLPAGRGRRVLLVEDHPVNQRVATALLGQRGHRVAIAEDGLSAVMRAAAEDFDVILIDVQMPPWGGLGATRRIRAAEAVSSRHTTIFAMAAHALQATRAECLAAGMDGLVPKPFEPGELFAAVESGTPPLEAANPLQPANPSGEGPVS
jgi:ligand-binding sensor domain-containing protein/signal transduction histidine kinase/ActR/RegA family two-component response regulator